MMKRTKRNRRLRLNSVTALPERLEARELLDASGFLWGDAPQLTLSFAADGTQVAGLRSALQQTFDDLGTAEDWQGTVLRAFQTWASQTNGDVGVVNDAGLPFGVPGLARDDARFGDIRVAAVPLAPDVLAVSIPSDTLVAGSWSGDVLFNSNVAWTSLEDLFSVALHEAGHVFGMEHNDDPNSPMHVHGVSDALAPTSADIAVLQALHGARMHDLNEYDGGGNDGTSPRIYIGNEDLQTATRLQASHDGQGPDGSAPTIAHADISTSADVDYYWFDGLSDYAGPVTITVRPSGMSLLEPIVRLLNEQGEILQTVASDSQSGETVTMTIAENDRHAKYYLQVAGAAGVLGIGHYSVSVAFDDVVTADPARIERFAGREFRFATSHQIRDLFELGVDSFFNDDEHVDDDPLNSGDLETALGYVEDTRYEAIGSISDAVDVDHYRFKSPRVGSGNDVPLTIAIDALESNGLIPQLELLTSEERPVATTIVSNGLGRLVVQLPAATLDDEYLLRVKATPDAGAHATGNYKLSIVFGGQPVAFVDFASGIVSADAPVNVHALHVGQSQLVHLLLDLSNTESNSNGVWATVFDSAGAVRGRVGARSGDARSAGALLLEPGAYVVQVGGVSLNGALLTETAYRLRGAVISDPLGPILHDPTFDPVYNCPGQSDVYCYPGGVQSTSPYLWSDFIETTPGGAPPTDPNDLYNNWWTWFWSLQPGDTNGDQSVDIMDLNNVRNHIGETGQAPLGDANGDGAVGIDDLNQVRNHFGAGIVSPAPIAGSRSMVMASNRTRATSLISDTRGTDAVFASIANEKTVIVARRRTHVRSH